MADMTDQELIEKGLEYARLEERAQMKLGEFALAFAPIGQPGSKTGTYQRLQEYADAIGVDFGSLKNYRATAHAWQAVKIDNFGFTTLKALAPVAKKQELLEAMREAKPDNKSGRWTAEAAVEFAKENGYWSHSSSPGSGPSLTSRLDKITESLREIGDIEDEAQREQLAQALDRLAAVVEMVREKLAPPVAA